MSPRTPDFRPPALLRSSSRRSRSLPGRHPGPGRCQPADRTRRGRRHRRPERLGQVDAGSSPQRAAPARLRARPAGRRRRAPASTLPAWRPGWGSRSKIPIASSSPVASRRRSSSGRGTSGSEARSWPSESARRWRPSGSTAADANPYDLGYSRRKLLALASVLAMRTPVLILDEPTTGQDARGVARVQAVVAARGRRRVGR